ncbi:GrpB family protein [Bacillus sp. B-jedd]|uniref:GrpB family protein n=1 Tax=Bacillus sp. B-jedd TaxID=1476857 RepID=UPI0005155A98|nr:GrpB family protein [Bacillus sp. B-jedd]CEG27066.1 acetyltransferase YqkA [Bacillus sp. B-jedd]
MKLGLRKDEVRLVEYNPEWAAEFAKVKEELRASTNLEEFQIEHIGSTSIPGMLAKPIIDMVVGIRNLSNFPESLAGGLKKAGFLRLRVERPGEIVFARFTDNTYEVKTHFIHLVEYEGELWQNLIFFRDYLRTNEDARWEYQAIKMDSLARYQTGVNEYTDHKEDFVKAIFAKRAVI